MGKGIFISVGITIFTIIVLNVCGVSIPLIGAILIGLGSSLIGIGIDYKK